MGRDIFSHHQRGRRELFDPLTVVNSIFFIILEGGSSNEKWRGLETTIWKEISRHVEKIIGCYSNKDQSTFSEREKLLFETI